MTIDLLTKEEKQTVCDLITGKHFRELFKQNEREFNGIRKGFRAKSLTEQSALKIAKDNVETPLVSNWVNYVLEYWLDNIREQMEELKQEDVSKDEALAISLADSLFGENVDLYLKVAKVRMTKARRAALSQRVRDIIAEWDQEELEEQEQRLMPKAEQLPEPVLKPEPELEPEPEEKPKAAQKPKTQKSKAKVQPEEEQDQEQKPAQDSKPKTKPKAGAKQEPGLKQDLDQEPDQEQDQEQKQGQKRKSGAAVQMDAEKAGKEGSPSPKEAPKKGSRLTKADLEGIIQELNDKIHELSMELSDLAEAQSMFDGEKKRLNDSLAAAVQEKENLQASLTTARSERTALKKEKKKLESDLSKAEKEKRKLESTLAKADTEKTKLSTALSEAEQARTAQKTRLSEAEAEKAKLAADLEGAKKELAEARSDNVILTEMVSQAEQRAAELETARTAAMGKKYGAAPEVLRQYDDTDTTVLPAADSDNTMSLCMMGLNPKGNRWLVRVADLGQDGVYHLFQKNDSLPLIFANRDRLFCSKEDNYPIGYYGVWTWNAAPSDRGPNYDYVTSRHNRSVDPIEVIIVQEAASLEDLGRLLKEGLARPRLRKKVMFAVRGEKDQYAGFLCDASRIQAAADGKITFAEGCTDVPVYEFTVDDIMRLQDGTCFFKKAFAGIPSGLYPVLSRIEAARETVLSFLSWDAYKTRGGIQADYSKIEAFLSALPVKDAAEMIASRCRCTQEEAKAALEEFLRTVHQYMDGMSLEDQVLQIAVSENPGLQERMKRIVRADWEAENKQLLAEAQERLNDVEFKLEVAAEDLAKAEAELEVKQSDVQSLTQSIAEKEQLAADVEQAVADRIQKARNNAADFIAEMAFVGGQPASAPAPAPSPADTPLYPAAPARTVYRIHEAYQNLADLQAHHSWGEVLDTAAFEFGGAGVADAYRGGLAAYLCAAYIEKQPVLLVGPNADDIAEAFCASVTAQKYGLLCCEGPCSSAELARIGSQGEGIVLIRNLFEGGWVNRLPEILSAKDVFFISTHPYSEDIQVEPKSLFSVMLPLFTETFVDKKATGPYYGGYFAEDFKPYASPSRRELKEVQVLSRLGISPLLQNRINTLVSIVRDINPAAATEDDFLFAALPIAYASQKTAELMEAVADPQSGMTVSDRLRGNLQYLLGDDA